MDLHHIIAGAVSEVVGADEALGKELAMHIAASKPVALSKDEVPADFIKKERDMAAAKAAEFGKPSDIVEKMIEVSQRSDSAWAVIRQRRQADC